MLHLDIMDGVYVPNISFGFDTVKAISRITDTELDVHMMTSCPDRYIEKLRDCGADRVTLHENTCVNGSTREDKELRNEDRLRGQTGRERRDGA